DGTARLWDGTSYRIRAALNHQEPIHSVAFSPGGNLLLTGGEQGSIRLWDTTRGIQRKRFAEHAGPVVGLAFLPDGSAFVSGSADQSLRLWKATQGVAPLAIVPAHRPETLGVVFSPDGKWLITTGADRLVSIR